MTAYSPEHTKKIRDTVIKNAEESYVAVREYMVQMTPTQFFAAVKFKKVSCEATLI